jgi:hypothetical protein
VEEGYCESERKFKLNSNKELYITITYKQVSLRTKFWSRDKTPYCTSDSSSCLRL